MILVYIIIIFYINLVVFNLSNKNLEKKLRLNLMEFDSKNLKSILFQLLIIILIDLKFGNSLGLNILLMYYCNTNLSISLRQFFSNLYYKYMILFSLQETEEIEIFCTIFNFSSKIKQIIFHQYFRNYGYNLVICCISVKLWLLYWLLMEYFDFFNLSLKDEFDKAMFNKSRGQDIILTSNGNFKLNIYKRVLLDKQKSMYSEFRLVFNLDLFDLPCLEHGEDFNYVDPEIEYMAKIECF